MDDQGRGFIFVEAKATLTGLEAQRSKILHEREETWRLRIKSIWLKAGDDNTKFFHNYSKGRRVCNTVWKMSTDHGQYAHFPRFVDPNISEDLTKPITIGELESTLKWFKEDKIPSPDGWSVEF